ncbi:MAG TPA: TetR/AcrR family transcriptional regulator [Natronosporangium sp.]|nr:TetR/AcrR family transcriptional regulator [Natronosporangium sp.]
MRARQAEVNGSAPAAAPAERAPGRRARWADHRERRREALVRAATRAVLRHGPEVDMDQVASVAGVSKPVLYRYFTDKTALLLAVGEHLAAKVVTAVSPAIERVREERSVVAAAIDAYLSVIERNPRLYRFVMGGYAAQPAVRDARQQVAAGLARVIGERLRSLGLDAGPAEPWAHGLVGFVQAVGDWWMARGRPVPRAALTDYLTTLLWSGVDGVRRGAGQPAGAAAVDGRRP